MKVDLNDVKEDYARKDAEIEKLEGELKAYKSKYSLLEDEYQEIQARVNSQNGMLTLNSVRIEELQAEKEKVKKLEFMVENGLGYEDLQQDSMQSHLN